MSTKSYSYTIQNSNGLTGGSWGDTYGSLVAAKDALRTALGWDEIELSDSFTVSETQNGYEAYETEAELSAHPDGDPSAPRVVASLADLVIQLSDAEREQVKSLRSEAKQNGDDDTSDFCGEALAGDEDAIRKCRDTLAGINVTAHGLTFSEWLEAAGRSDSASEHDLRAAWRAGEEPSDYEVQS